MKNNLKKKTLGIFTLLLVSPVAYSENLIEYNNYATLSLQSSVYLNSEHLAWGFVLEGDRDYVGMSIECHSDFKKGFYLKGKALKALGKERSKPYALPLFEVGYRYTFYDTVTAGVQLYNRYNYFFDSFEGHPLLTIGVFL